MVLYMDLNSSRVAGEVHAKNEHVPVLTPFITHQQWVMTWFLLLSPTLRFLCDAPSLDHLRGLFCVS